MSPALSGSLALWHVKLGDALEIRVGIIFDFYPGLPHIKRIPYVTCSVGLAQACHNMFGLLIHTIHASGTSGFTSMLVN